MFLRHVHVHFPCVRVFCRSYSSFDSELHSCLLQRLCSCRFLQLRRSPLQLDESSVCRPAGRCTLTAGTCRPLHPGCRLLQVSMQQSADVRLRRLELRLRVSGVRTHCDPESPGDTDISHWPQPGAGPGTDRRADGGYQQTRIAEC